MLVCEGYSFTDQTQEVLKDPEVLHVMVGQSYKLSCFARNNATQQKYFVKWMFQKSDTSNWATINFNENIKMDPNGSKCNNTTVMNLKMMNNDHIDLTADYSLIIANVSLEMQGQYICILKATDLPSYFLGISDILSITVHVHVPVDAPNISRNTTKINELIMIEDEQATNLTYSSILWDPLPMVN